jgi:hypothetical protein
MHPTAQKFKLDSSLWEHYSAEHATAFHLEKAHYTFVPDTPIATRWQNILALKHGLSLAAGRTGALHFVKQNLAKNGQ